MNRLYPYNCNSSIKMAHPIYLLRLAVFTIEVFGKWWANNQEEKNGTFYSICLNFIVCTIDIANDATKATTTSVATAKGSTKKIIVTNHQIVIYRKKRAVTFSEWFTFILHIASFWHRTSSSHKQTRKQLLVCVHYIREGGFLCMRKMAWHGMVWYEQSSASRA